MKYLLITLEYPPFHGGVAHYYGNLVAHSPEQIDVMTNESGELIDDRWPILAWLPGMFKLASKIKGGYNYLLVGHILPLGTMAWLLSYLLPVRYCLFLHGFDLSCAQATSRKLWLTKNILSRADKIIAANSRTADETKKLLVGSDWCKVVIVNPGIDTKQLAYNEGAIRELKKRYNLKGKSVLLTIGRLVQRKGHDLVIRALAKVVKIKPETVYVIIGRGLEEANLRRLIKDLKIEANVRLLTEVEDEEKSYWLQLAEIFIMISRDQAGDYEGFGIVYLEAGLYGKPVIAARGGGVTDAVIDNETGILVDSNSIEDIASVILKLTEFEGLRRRLGDAGRQRAINDFNWEEQAKKIYNLISKP